MEMMMDRVDKINGILDGMDAGFSVSFERVAKNNATLDALAVRPDESGVMAPVVYLNGELLEKTDAELAYLLKDMYMSNRRQAPDMAAMLAKERVLGTVLPKLVSADNAERLAGKEIVHKRILDLLVCYYMPVDEFGTTDGSTIATIQVTEPMLRHANISMEELGAAALENMREEVEIRNMADMLQELTGTPMPGCDEGLPMLVISNRSHYLGAGVILLPSVREELARILGCDSYYILPSSIHECIVIPDDSHMDSEALVDMVKEINGTVVDPADRLSDSVYIVRGSEFSIAG